MPTYRSITTSLISQFDLLTIPEYPPPVESKDPFTATQSLVDEGTITVYIPTYPSSQFWLCYSISPPIPPKQLFYFKLYLNGACVLSWGCGEEDGYAGKTMFGLFDSGETFFGQPAIEKRLLCFSNENGKLPDLSFNNLQDVMEIEVFRSKGRQRIPPELLYYKNVAAAKDSTKKSPQQHGAGGISLVNAGLIPTRHPRQYYKYALTDSLEKPFATFRYFYRSWEHLQRLGIRSMSPLPEICIDPSPSPHSNSPLERANAPTNDSTVTISSDSTFLSLSSVGNNEESSYDLQPAVAIKSLSRAVQALRPITPILEERSSSVEDLPLDVSNSLISTNDHPPAQSRPRTPKHLSASTSLADESKFADLQPILSPAKTGRTVTPTPSPTKPQRGMSMGMLLDVVSNAVRRRPRGESQERGPVARGMENERFGEESKKSLALLRNGDVEIATSTKTQSGNDASPSMIENSKTITTMIKSSSADTTKESTNNEAGEGMISRERRGRMGRKLERKEQREIGVWETL